MVYAVREPLCIAWVISDDGDTLSVFIDDENPDVVQGGLLAGDRIALIGYKAEDGEMMAQKIINLTSLLGKWTSLDKILISWKVER